MLGIKIFTHVNSLNSPVLPQDVYVTSQRSRFGPPWNLHMCISLWNSLDLDSSWVEDSIPCQFSYLHGVLARLAMRHTRVFGVRIPNDAY